MNYNVFTPMDGVQLKNTDMSKKHTKSAWEEDAARRFIKFLKAERGIEYKITGRDCPVENGKNFDYALRDRKSHSKIALEIFRLTDSKGEIVANKTWGRVVDGLKKKLLEKNLGGYLISTPRIYVKTRDLSSYVEDKAKVIEKAIRDNPGSEKIETKGFEIRKNANFDHVVFMGGSGARSIDPPGEALGVFQRKLPVKNKQVAISDHERVLLVINQAFFVDKSDAIRALASINFSQFPNVDRIFFETQRGNFTEVFDKQTLELIGRGKLKDKDKVAPPLLSLTLRYKLRQHDMATFRFIQSTVESRGNFEWLADPDAREEIVRFGEYLVEQGNLENAMWVIRSLADDPDPEIIDSNAIDDEQEPSYHTKILAEEDINVITTVRGHLCHLITDIVNANKPKYYTELIGIIRKYIFGPDLYIRLQALYPLRNLVARRYAKKTSDGHLFRWRKDEGEKVRKIALEGLRNNKNTPRILEGLVMVFDFIRDLNTKEAEEVLGIFINSSRGYVLDTQLAGLIIYFALFRKRHFSKLKKFNDEKCRKILQQQILSGTSEMRSSITWHFAKLIRDRLAPYSDIQEYVELFWSTPYDPHVFSNLGHMIEHLVNKQSKTALNIYLNILKAAKETITHQGADSVQYIAIDGTEEIISQLACDPDLLVSVLDDLFIIWEAGESIGDPRVMFESYKLVAASDQKRVKLKLQNIYRKMKTMNPRLCDVDWGVPA